MKIGYHISHEQFSPDRLLKLAKGAEASGFEECLSADHFHPWSEKQGQSGFAWSWLGAALQATGINFGIVTSPGQRYHPAIIAQAAATLNVMFPGRLWLAAGSGELLNEKITGGGWPSKDVRKERLLECVEIMRALWKGETVTGHGLIKIEEAKLYTLPQKQPYLFGAALTTATAKWAGTWADGLLTAASSRELLQSVIVAFRNSGGNNKPVYAKIDIAYAASEQEALQEAWEQWRTNIFGSPVAADIPSPQEFDQISRFITPEDIKKVVRVFTKMEDLRNFLEEFRSTGVDQIFLHNVTGQQELFLKDFYQYH